MDTVTNFAERSSRLPLRVFVIVLGLAFAFEAGVMALLDVVVPKETDARLVAIVDAVLLTLALSPALWFLVVRPLRELFVMRGRLLAWVFDAQEQERARLARDLHDELGQHLTAILVGLRTIEQARDMEQARERCRSVGGLGTNCIAEVRRLARGLRPTVLEDLGLGPALQRLCEEFGAAHPIKVEFQSGIEGNLRHERGIELCVFRVTQEALTNVARHAAAQHVRVDVNCDQKTLKLTVQDDGRGFAVGARSSRGPSIGLDSMRERVTLVNGRFRLVSRPGAGTTIRVEVPCSERHDEPDSSNRS